MVVLCDVDDFLLCAKHEGSIPETLKKLINMFTVKDPEKPIRFLSLDTTCNDDVLITMIQEQLIINLLQDTEM